MKFKIEEEVYIPRSNGTTNLAVIRGFKQALGKDQVHTTFAYMTWFEEGVLCTKWVDIRKLKKKTEVN